MSTGEHSAYDPSTESFYEVNGTRLRYLDSGNGEGEGRLPVVFLHPTPLDRDYWRPLVQRLEGVRAIVPDLRGHGASEMGRAMPPGSFARVPDAAAITMEQLAEDVVALLDHLNLRKAAFVGCSIGGYVLFAVWRRAPERVRGLAFVCSKPQPDEEANLAKRAATIAKARAEGVGAIFDAMAESLTGATARRKHPAMAAEVRARMTLSVDALVAVQAGLAMRPDSRETVSTISVPVLAVAGGEDVAVSAADMEALRDARGGCEYHLLADAGHFAAYEQPDKVAGLMTAWLKRFARMRPA